MTPSNSNAPVRPDRGVGNIIALHQHPHFTSRLKLRKPLRAAVRVFVGRDAAKAACAWMQRQGPGTALTLDEGGDPAAVVWPAGSTLVLVPVAYDLMYPHAAAIAAAWQRDGVAYGCIPHEPHWPNLWPLRRAGGAQ